MLQIYTYSDKKIIKSLCDNLQETNMPSADNAERLVSTCLNRAGSSGYLGSGASMCTGIIR